ncbi:4Fe-4S dicluster domain-containing protein, partial [Nocardioides sp. Y6]|nr:4Fe-4S dicluster domain-containing protein [Nocardioides malaquae]
GVFYFVFAWFREQVCIIACPYGRLQSVLLDNKSIVVAYDHKRGEGKNGRKKFRKNENRNALGHGDCIDCLQCVNVCPTGIDIRNGTQLEC